MAAAGAKGHKELLDSAKTFFREHVVEPHVGNVAKLSSLSKFNVNPFLTPYLARFLGGNLDAANLARALLYPRILGTSITTSFGVEMQRFCHEVLPGYASTVTGLDIEYVDAVDGRRKYCQTKAGPQCINHDDVATIVGHFTKFLGIAKTNGLHGVETGDLVVGVFYGTPEELSGNYKNIEKQHNYSVVVGHDFWHRLTGEPDFYEELISSFADVAGETGVNQKLEDLVQELSADIEKNGQWLLGDH